MEYIFTQIFKKRNESIETMFLIYKNYKSLLEIIRIKTCLLDDLIHKTQTLKDQYIKLELMTRTEKFLAATKISALRFFNDNINLKAKSKDYKNRLKKLNEAFIKEKGSIRVFLRLKPIAFQGNPNISNLTINKETLHLTSNKVKKESYMFSKIFSNSKTYEIFSELKPFIFSFLMGNNICILAYGQTGAGKTYTMEGKDSFKALLTPSTKKLKKEEIRNEDFGLIPLTLLKVLSEVSFKASRVSVSVLEIYNESITDLLADRECLKDSKKLKEDNSEFRNCQSAKTKKLKINYNVGKNNSRSLIRGLTEKEIGSFEDFGLYYSQASMRRKTRETKMNQESSRSHLMVIVNLYKKSAPPARLLLGDLAGSERILRSEVQGDSLKESTSINSSLSCLQRVLRGLRKKEKHIPFRDSKLTYLLQSVLNAQTGEQDEEQLNRVIMLCHCSSEEKDLEETRCTLRFGALASSCVLGKVSQISEEKDESDTAQAGTKKDQLLERSFSRQVSRKSKIFSQKEGSVMDYSVDSGPDQRKITRLTSALSNNPKKEAVEPLKSEKREARIQRLYSNRKSSAPLTKCKSVPFQRISSLKIESKGIGRRDSANTEDFAYKKKKNSRTNGRARKNEILRKSYSYNVESYKNLFFKNMKSGQVETDELGPKREERITEEKCEVSGNKNVKFLSIGGLEYLSRRGSAETVQKKRENGANQRLIDKEKIKFFKIEEKSRELKEEEIKKTEERKENSNFENKKNSPKGGRVKKFRSERNRKKRVSFV